jgi:ribonuclease G
MRDVVSSGVDKVSVDHRRRTSACSSSRARSCPDMAERIQLYDGDRPIFDLYGIEEKIQKSLDRKVPLKSGGYLIFDQTESMTTIDVNTGAYVGHRTLRRRSSAPTSKRPVAIARPAAAAQPRRHHHRRLHRHAGGGAPQAGAAGAREIAGQRSRQEPHFLGVAARLVEMTRKRTRESLEHMLCMACPTCEGRGFVKTPETVCYEIFREILRQARQFEFQELMVLAHQDVIERLLDEESAALAELEVHTGKPIRLQTEALYNQDQYDVVLM